MRFFHSFTLKRCKQNKIEALRINENEWFYDEETVKRHVIEYFSNLYTVEPYAIGNLPIKGRFPKLWDSFLRALNVQITMDGVDGFHAKFYQTNQDIMENSVYKLVRHIYVEGHLDPSLNKMLLVIIPKSINVDSIQKFRPINLCPVLYKITTKTIVIQLRHVMLTLVKQKLVQLYSHM